MDSVFPGVEVALLHCYVELLIFKFGRGRFSACSKTSGLKVPVICFIAAAVFGEGKNISKQFVHPENVKAADNRLL